MLEIFYSILMLISQLIMSSECGECVTEGIVEHQSNGTYVGSISPSTEKSTGFWISDDGSIVFENRLP